MAEPSKYDLIANRYSVLYTLGKGGMGVVFRCRDTTLQRDVAVKVLGDKSDLETAKRFQTEAKAAAKLQHENILQVMDFGESDGLLFLVMDYLDGITLTDLIRQNIRLEPEAALPILIQICDGIAHAHKKGVLHRDIKPSNIMLIETELGWTVKIVDFGIAKITSSADQKLTTTGTVVGSPLYISPEAGIGKRCDSRSDIYSLGCLMFETLTGKPPFHGDTAFETIMMHKNDAPPSISESAGISFDSNLEEVIAKCLEKQPSKRYQTVEELRRELHSINDSVIQASPQTAVVDGESDLEVEQEQISLQGSPSKRNQLLLSLIGLIGVMSAVFIMWTYTPVTHTAPARKITVLMKSSPPESMVEKPTQLFKYDPKQRVLRADRSIDDKQLSDISGKYSMATTWSMQGASVNGSFLKNLIKYPIHSLELKETEIDGEAIKTISKMRFLNHLDIRKCKNVRPEDLEPLSGLPEFTTIQISLPEGRAKSLEMIRAIRKIKALRYCTIDQPLVSAEMVAELKPMQNLIHLKAPFSPSDSVAMGRALADLPHLTELLDSNQGLNEVSLAELAKRQKELQNPGKISRLQIDLPDSLKQQIEILKTLNDFPSLEILQIDCVMSARVLEELCKLPKLKYVNLPDDISTQVFANELNKLSAKCGHKIIYFKSSHIRIL